MVFCSVLEDGVGYSLADRLAGIIDLAIANIHEIDRFVQVIVSILPTEVCLGILLAIIENDVEWTSPKVMIGCAGVRCAPTGSRGIGRGCTGFECSDDHDAVLVVGDIGLIRSETPFLRIPAFVASRGDLAGREGVLHVFHLVATPVKRGLDRGTVRDLLGKHKSELVLNLGVLASLHEPLQGLSGSR